MSADDNTKQTGASEDAPVSGSQVGVMSPTMQQVHTPSVGPPLAESRAAAQAEADGVDCEANPHDILQELMAELLSIETSELRQVNLAVDEAVATVLGCLPKVRALQAEIVQLLPSFDLTLLEGMERYAMALNATQGLYLVATEPNQKFQKVIEEALVLRKILVSEVATLVQRGLLPPGAIDDLKGPVGHRNIASDLHHIAAALQCSWPRVSGMTAVTKAELGRAIRLQVRILRMLGERKEQESRIKAARVLRNRAFTRFVQAWEELRRAVSHLRWYEGDAGSIAPSLYRGRGHAKRSGSDTDAVPPAPTVQVATGQQ